MNASAKSKTPVLNGLDGKELMRQINDGGITKATLEQVAKVRDEVVDAMTELLEAGARVRPLLVDRKQVGWIRGLHFTERKWIERYIVGAKEQILHCLMLGTSFTKDELLACTSLEIQGLSRIVSEMSERDVTLFPYISAFATTSASESLWFSRGSTLANYDRRELILPGGEKMQVIAASEHSRLWVSLCTMREQAKQRLDDNFNAAMIVRSNVGKNANSIITELKGVSRSLATDITDPWENIVRVTVSKDDGWAHTEDSYEGLKREMDAMLSNDRHERLIEKFHAQQYNEAKEKQEKVAKLFRDRIPELEDAGIEVISDKDINTRQRSLRKGQAAPGRRQRPEDRESSVAGVQERMKRYRE